MTVFDCGGKPIAYQVERKPIRHVYLKVKPDLTVEVSVPERSNIDVQRILEKKRHWIEAKIKILSRAKKIFEDGRVLYKGEYLKVEVVAANKPHKGYRKYSKTLHVYENANSGGPDEILERFLTDETLRFVKKKAPSFAKKIHVTLNGVSIKETKRWAYCTMDRNLIFNWRLIALPEPLAEYVVAHEILHLKHFNHSKQYKSAMASLITDYKEREQALKSFQC